MLSGLTYDEALAKARPGLRHRIEQSVAILRKAERLALRYDRDDGFFLAFSGGKDSQALYHIAEIAGVRFKAHFSPTTVDPPKLIMFIKRNYPEVEFLRPEKSMYQAAKDMGMVPTMRLRWCCAKFKETAGAGKVTLTGVRRAESVRRAKRNPVEVSGHKFSGDLEGFFEWSEEKVRKKVKNLNHDEFSRDKGQEIRCIGGKDSIIVNPMLEWTDTDVWDFLNKVCEVPHCCLYDPPFNQHRIGCILCPMASRKQKLRDIELYPYTKEKWLDVFEYFIGGGYDPDYIKRKSSKSESYTPGGQHITLTGQLHSREWRSNISKPIEHYLREHPETATALCRKGGRQPPPERFIHQKGSQETASPDGEKPG